jgi:hypothetical protein
MNPDPLTITDPADDEPYAIAEGRTARDRSAALALLCFAGLALLVLAALVKGANS